MSIFIAITKCVSVYVCVRVCVCIIFNSSMYLISGFFPQWYAGTSLLDSQTSTKALLSVGNDQNQCSMGGRR